MITNEVLVHSYGIGAGVFWLLTYVAIIWRGFKDRLLAIPMVALSANISWEAIFSFFYMPPVQLIHYSSIAWFCFNLIIAGQCLIYGVNDTQTKFTKNNFHVIFLVAIAVSFSIIYRIVYDFNDIKGAYSGYGINLIMSILFVERLIRRDDIRGESIYIAIFKFLGTFFAIFASFFGSAIDIHAPVNLHMILGEIISVNTYSLKLVVRVIYPVIFLIDILYITLLYNKCREKKVNPWTF